MLKEIHIDSYKSLKNVTVQFKEGLNIIIGKNGSGKSNLLEFIKFCIGLKPFLTNTEESKKYPQDNFSYSFVYRQEQSDVELNVHVRYEKYLTNSGLEVKPVIKVSKTSLNEGLNSYHEFKFDSHQYYKHGGFEDLLKQLQFIPELYAKLADFHIPNELLWLERSASYRLNRSVVKVNNERNDISFVVVDAETDGLNFTFFLLHSFQRRINESKIDFSSVDVIEQIKAHLLDVFNQNASSSNLEENLNLFSPIESIRVGANINFYLVNDDVLIENLTIDFKISGTWVPWSYLSDGTKRMFYIIAEICCADGGVILIEEPELGIHPHQLYKLMAFIKEQSEKKQIIISTHSPLVLDTLDEDELDRITIAKAENGSSHFYKLTEEQIEKAKIYMHEEMDLSFYWLHSDLEGE